MASEKIFIGDISADLKKEQLQDFLKQFGEISSLQWKMRSAFNRAAQDSDQKAERVKIAHAVVEFSSYKQEGGASKVIELLDGKSFPSISKPSGEPLRAKIYEKREPKEPKEKTKKSQNEVSGVAREPKAFNKQERTVPSKYKIFVRNLPFSYNSGKLRELFESKGFEVAFSQILRDRVESKNGGTFLRSRGYGFVEFGVKRPQADVDLDQTQVDLENVKLEESGGKKIRVKTHKHRKDLTAQEEAAIAKEVQRAVQEVNGLEVEGRQLAVAVSMERDNEKKEE